MSANLAGDALPLETLDRIRAQVQARNVEMVAFARRLIQTPSLSGEEGSIAHLVKTELERIRLDEVWIDRTGNVIGVMRGESAGRSMHFNTHLDHVSAGDLGLWPVAPFDGVVRDGVLYGRGASDVKGAMAAQVYAMAILCDLGLKPPGDVYFAGVVLEEVGGFGSQRLAIEMPTDIAVIGEASQNNVRRGHRGRVFGQVSFTGLSAHASAPERARNPHYAAARFLLKLEQLLMLASETFGGSSASPTLSATDQVSGNVTPGTVDIFVDWRNVPEEPSSDIQAKLESIAIEAAEEAPGIEASVTIAGRQVRSYTGLEAEMPSTVGFEMPLNHPVVQTAARSLERVFDRPVQIGVWTFATDGGHLAQAGIDCIGFAPGSEVHAHTIHDQVSLNELQDAMIGNVALALTLGRT